MSNGPVVLLGFGRSYFFFAGAFFLATGFLAGADLAAGFFLGEGMIVS
jgi:hypothetical protein